MANNSRTISMLSEAQVVQQINLISDSLKNIEMMEMYFSKKLEKSCKLTLTDVQKKGLFQAYITIRWIEDHMNVVLGKSEDYEAEKAFFKAHPELNP